MVRGSNDVKQWSEIKKNY